MILFRVVAQWFETLLEKLFDKLEACWQFNSLNVKSAAKQNEPRKPFRHKIEIADRRFFMFTLESVKALTKQIPSVAAFTVSSDNLTWILNEWQKKSYASDPFHIPPAGFLLIDNLQKVVVDNGAVRSPCASPSHLKALWKESWSQQPVVSSWKTPKSYIHARRMEKKLKDFRRLTKELRSLGRKQRQELRLCVATKKRIENARKHGADVSQPIYQQLEQHLQTLIERFYHTGQRIRGLKTSVQYELRPALEALDQEYAAQSRACQNGPNIPRARVVDSMIWDSLKGQIADCAQDLQAVDRIRWMMELILQTR
ncbi:unnamed protein product [Gongylonema pulchrum]|uniref:Transposase n=1 Tax=Gongylonema pulchrum TaxID=637853 RepID=A0A183D341_9BILA|nr:unnamed protein product [Gongylonema pulchrum]